MSIAVSVSLCSEFSHTPMAVCCKVGLWVVKSLQRAPIQVLTKAREWELMTDTENGRRFPSLKTRMDFRVHVVLTTSIKRLDTLVEDYVRGWGSGRTHPHGNFCLPPVHLCIQWNVTFQKQLIFFQIMGIDYTYKLNYHLTDAKNCFAELWWKAYCVCHR